MVHAAAARLVAAFLLLALVASPLLAQEATQPAPAALPEDLRGVDVDALMARLSDEQVRTLLLDELRREAERDAAAATAGAGMVGSVDASGARLKELWQETVASLDDIPRTIAESWRRLATGPGPGQGLSRVFFILVGVAIVIGAGLLAEGWYRRRTAEIRARIVDAPAGSPAVRVGRGLLRSFLDLLSIAAFALPVVVLFVVVEPPNPTVRMFIAAYIVALLIVRLAGVVSRIVFAPYAPALRFVPIDDAEARYLHRKALEVAAVWSFGYFTCELMHRTGLADPAHRLMVVSMGVILTALFISIVWHFREPVARAFKGPDYNHDDLAANSPGLRLRAQFADLWHVLAMVYLIAAWAIWGLATLLDSPAVRNGAGESMLMIFLLPVVSAAIRQVLVAFLGEDDELSHVDAIMRGVNVLLVMLLLALIWAAWGGDMQASAASTVGETAAQAGFNIFLTLVMADVLWKIARTAIDRRLRAEGIDPDAEKSALPGGEGEGGGGGSRVGTLLPLARKTVAVVLGVIVAMTILSSLGVDIGPILAGAGVVGLAVGFGAQTLVRDIVSGVFFLIDDAFRIGEYIDVGEAKGTVENISIRSIRLRHHRGPLNTIPFGEIKKVQNLSRDWVIMKLEFRVPYDTDVKQVKKIIKRIGAELLEDPEMGPNFLEPLKSQGVYAMEDSAMVIKVKFMAKPGEQFVIRREAYQRIRAAFEAEGIPFAHRIVTVKATGPDEAAGAAAAAAAAAEQEKAAQPA